MDFEIISVFPDLVNAVLPFGVAGRAHAEGRYRVRCWNPRDDAPGSYRRDIPLRAEDTRTAAPRRPPP